MFKQNAYVFLRKTSDEKYVNMFKSDPYDFCQVVSGQGRKMSPISKIIFDSYKKIAPEFLHACPYVGVHSIQNMTYSREFITFYPTGTFRTLCSVSDGENIFFKMIVDYTMA
jgi:hypothetical protein